MQKLAPPTGLRLTDPETGRESTSLRVTFDLVADATSYELSLDAVPWPTPAMPGDWIGPLQPNTVYSMFIVARANGFDDSDPSAPVAVLTRPPTPSTLSRAPIDLSGWGIVLDWDESCDWNGAAHAFVLLRRSDDGKSPTLITRADLTHRHIDTHYPLSGEKVYDSLVATTSPLDGRDNLSRVGPSVSARGPIQAVAAGTTNQPLAASQQKSERMTRALLGLRH